MRYQNLFLFLIGFIITFFFFLYNSLYNNSNTLLFINLGIVIYYLYLDEFNRVNKWSKWEKVFLLILLVGSTILIFWVNNIFWIILLLEIQSFIILGNSAIFYSSRSHKYLNATEAAFVYLIPSFTSLICFLGAALSQIVNFTCSINSYYLIIIALCIKLGATPFHFWIPQVINNLDYKAIILLSGLNKIPIIYLTQLINPSGIFLLILGTFSITIGSCLMLNTIKIKELIAYSGIINSGWIILVITIQWPSLLYLFFVIYLTSLILLTIISREKIFLKELKSPSYIFKKQNYYNVILYMSLISLGGLPPLLAFILKYLIILNILTFTNTFLFIFYLIFLSVVSIFIYLRPVTSDKNKILWEKIKQLTKKSENYYKETLSVNIALSMPLLTIIGSYILITK